jgi:hypothetical protein
MIPSNNAAGALPAVCYIRHPTNGETVAILHGEDGRIPDAQHALFTGMPQRETLAAANRGRNQRHEARFDVRVGHARRSPRFLASQG